MTETTKEILTDEQINKAWGNACFGNKDNRAIIANALLKKVCGYSTGHTIACICAELKLVGKNKTLTKLGREYLWAYYSNGVSV